MVQQAALEGPTQSATGLQMTGPHYSPQQQQPQPQPQQQPQQSPQQAFYQQQILKSAQQQQQQQLLLQQPTLNNLTRINGITQYSTTTNHQQQVPVEPMYSAQRTLYSPPQSILHQPLYQTRVPPTTGPTLTYGRAANGVPGPLPLSAAVQQTPVPPPTTSQAQQQPAPQLIMAYQLAAGEPQMLATANGYLTAANPATLHSLTQNSTASQQHNSAPPRQPIWLDQVGPPVQQAHQQAQPHHNTSRAYVSDRDSISTQSRPGGPGDDRRSFTVRSQFTGAPFSATDYGRRFGPLQLLGAALRRTLGLSAHENHLRSNLTLIGGGGGDGGPSKPHSNGVAPGHSHMLGLAQQQQQSQQQVTAIDAGEDLYFKRKVFQCELALSRAFALLGALFVILSPVAMLLMPKLESFWNAASSGGGSMLRLNVGAGQQSSSSSLLSQLPSQPPWRILDCGPECDGPMLGFVARLLLLVLAHWAIYFRARPVTLPRLDLHRCMVAALAALLTLAYWLFFLFRLFDKRYNDYELHYAAVLQFALSMLESLIMLHYAALLLLELRPKQKAYCLKVLRSPDGQSRYYSCGPLSVQRCAQLVLDKYHRHFMQTSANRLQMMQLENEQAASLRGSSGESGGNTGTVSRRSVSRSSRHHSRAASSGAGRQSSVDREERLSPAVRKEPRAPENTAAENDNKTETNHNVSHHQDGHQPDRDRDDTESVRSCRSRRSQHRRAHGRSRGDQQHHHHHHSASAAATLAHDSDQQLEELEKRLRRRRLRLLDAVQDTFNQVSRLEEAPNSQQQLHAMEAGQASQSQAMSPSQTARFLYPRIARSLQKYLRITRQTGRHNLQSIHEHLSKCLLYKLSARAFLEKFTNQDPVWQANETNLFAQCQLNDSGPTSRPHSRGPSSSSSSFQLNSWSLVSETLSSRQIRSGTFFVLRQGSVNLLVTVAKLPHLNLGEELVDAKSCKFQLKPSSANTSAV